jgi:glutamate synthase (NADPH/NADH) small chain
MKKPRCFSPSGPGKVALPKPNDSRDLAPSALELPAFCPHCHQSLNLYDPRTNEVWLRMVITVGGRRGELLLGPKGKGWERMSKLPLTDGEIAEDLTCPNCQLSLVDPANHCGECGSLAARLVTFSQGKLSPLYFCTKVGCPWRGLPKVEVSSARVTTPRQKAPEQDSLLRIRNFQEVSYGFNRELALLEASRCLKCKNPRCVAGCPVEIDIPGFIQCILDGQFVDAARKIKETNALPAICGRVCPQEDQCEKACILGIKSEPVSIGKLERFAADFERETDAVTAPRKVPPTGFRVAVVGSGPGGLTMAADLAVRGHSVTVYESLHKPGGVLVYGIPEFRLPKSVVEAEINYLRRLGVKFEVNSIIGRLYTVEDLFRMGYHAVFLATGAGLPVFMGIHGENLCNIYSANEYLTRINLMKAYAFPEFDTPAPHGRTVAVVGAGNVAMDCARNALRMGSREATIVYRRSKEEAPARIEEIQHAEEEGVRFRFLTNPIRCIGDEQRWVRQLECVQMKLGDLDASGPRPIPIAGSNFLLEADMVVVAVGSGPNPALFAGVRNLARTERGYIQVFSPSGRTSIPNVWAGGDIVTGSATVISAMGAARKAARDMQERLTQTTGAWIPENTKPTP